MVRARSTLAAMVKAGTENKTAYKALPKVTNIGKAVVPTTAQSVAASAYVTSNWP